MKRESAKSSQEEAKKMVSLSNSRLPAVDIGTNVMVRVPDLDRGRLAPRNVLPIVVYVNSSGLYLLGTKEGQLERLYARNEITAADNFIEAHDVPSSSLSLRSASMVTSGSKQGFVSCHSKRYCIDKKCKCCLKNTKCNSVILTAPAKINGLCHCSSLGLRYMYFYQLIINSSFKRFRIVALSLMPQRVVVVYDQPQHTISRCSRFSNATCCGRFFRSMSVFDL